MFWPAFNGEDDLLGFAGVVVVEVEATVDAAICAFLDPFCGTSSNETQGPVLELVFVLGGELFGSAHVRGFADDLVGLADFGTECVA